MSKLVPLEDKILIVAEEKTKSLVLKPETKEKDRPTKGKVIDTGPEYKGSVKKGDTVFFMKFSVEAIEYNGVEHYVAIPADLLAIEK